MILTTIFLATSLLMNTNYAEPLRPQFHFTAQKNWLNDPNGLVWYDGTYHLFFQYNPHSNESAHKSWGHATSTDLIHWTEHDVAIMHDEIGDIWSGSAVVDHDNTSGFQTGKHKPIVLIYTSAGKPFTQRISYSADGGKSFTKYDKPVVEHIRALNRDPKVVWHAPTKRWVMALYLDGNDFVLLNSPDLKEWTQIQAFTIPGTDECPDFFEMPVENEPGKSAWVFMPANGKYVVGEFDGKQFKPEGGFDRAITSDHCRDFYAGQTFDNMPDGRRVQIAWFRDAQYPGMPFNQQLSIPTQLTLRRTREGLRLWRMPVKEVELLRESSVNSLNELTSDLLDFTVTIEPGSAQRVGLRVRGQTIAYDAKDKVLISGEGRAPLELIDGKFTLRVLLDRTSIEAFANDGQVSMSRTFVPDLNAKIEAPSFFSEGGEGRLSFREGYKLKSAWRK